MATEVFASSSKAGSERLPVKIGGVRPQRGDREAHNACVAGDPGGKTLLTDEQCSLNIKGNSVSLITHSVLAFFLDLNFLKFEFQVPMIGCAVSEGEFSHNGYY